MRTKIVNQEMCEAIKYALEVREGSISDVAKAFVVSVSTVSNIRDAGYSNDAYRTNVNRILKPLLRKQRAKRFMLRAERVKSRVLSLFGGDCR